LQYDHNHLFTAVLLHFLDSYHFIGCHLICDFEIFL
jgi:hypothetical protein